MGRRSVKENQAKRRQNVDNREAGLFLPAVGAEKGRSKWLALLEPRFSLACGPETGVLLLEQRRTEIPFRRIR